MGLSFSSFTRLRPEKMAIESKDTVRSSVIHLLLDHGNFKHLLEDIFFSLDPESLLSCSLACKSWSEFIEDNILSTPDGERRFSHNWMSKVPRMRHLHVGQWDGKGKMPEFHVFHDNLFVLHSYRINLFDISTGRFKHATEVEFTERFRHRCGLGLICSSSLYLIVVHRWIGSDESPVMHLLRVGSDRLYQLPMKERLPGERSKRLIELDDTEWYIMWIQPLEFCRIVNEDTLIMPPRTNILDLGIQRPVQAFRINEETFEYDLLWQVSTNMGAMSVGGDRMLIAHCDENKLWLKPHTLRKGKIVQIRSSKVKVPAGFYISWLLDRDPYCFALLYSLSQTERILLCCDMKKGGILSQMTIRSGWHPMWLEWNTRAGVFFMAVWDETDKSRKVLIWNMKGGAAGLMTSAYPDRIIPIEGDWSTAVRSSDTGFVYAYVKEGFGLVVVDCSFWGRL